MSRSEKACYEAAAEGRPWRWRWGREPIDRSFPKWGDIFGHHAVTYEYGDGVRVYAFCRQQDRCWRNASSLEQICQEYLEQAS